MEAQDIFGLDFDFDEFEKYGRDDFSSGEDEDEYEEEEEDGEDGTLRRPKKKSTKKSIYEVSGKVILSQVQCKTTLGTVTVPYLCACSSRLILESLGFLKTGESTKTAQGMGVRKKGGVKKFHLPPHAIFIFTCSLSSFCTLPRFSEP